MSAPSSNIDVINLALDLIRQDSITAIDPPVTEIETICARWYDQARRAKLEGHPWNFATKRSSLARAGTPSFGYADAYDLPTDFLRVNTLGSETDFYDHPVDYQIENGQILLNRTDLFASGTSLPIRYVYDFTNVSKMSPLFITSFAASIAVFLSSKIKSSLVDMDRLRQFEKDKTAEAKSVDGQQRPPIRISRSKLLQRRKTRGVVAGTRTVFD